MIPPRGFLPSGVGVCFVAWQRHPQSPRSDWPRPASSCLSLSLLTPFDNQPAATLPPIDDQNHLPPPSLSLTPISPATTTLHENSKSATFSRAKISCSNSILSYLYDLTACSNRPLFLPYLGEYTLLYRIVYISSNS